MIRISERWQGHVIVMASCRAWIESGVNSSRNSSKVRYKTRQQCQGATRIEHAMYHVTSRDRQGHIANKCRSSKKGENTGDIILFGFATIEATSFQIGL